MSPPPANHATQTSNRIASASISSASPTRGEQVTVTGKDFAAGEKVTATLEGGRTVGTATADPAGAVTVSFRVPVDLAPVATDVRTVVKQVITAILAWLLHHRPGGPGDHDGGWTTVAVVVPSSESAQPDHSDEPRPVPAPWGPASGVGSLPGTDPAEAVRLVLGELPEFPHLPELPARGPGADLIGRSAALLVDVAVDLTPAGWRLVPRAGLDLRRAKDLLARDLDALTEVADGYTGPFKVQSAGPFTLAAALERMRGDRAVVDAGARRDLAQSLAEGLAAHAAAVAARVPGARVVVQLDEPSIPAVLQGSLPTASGYGKLSAVEANVVEQELGAAVAALPGPVVVHCCAPRAPLALFRGAGAAGVSFDSGLVQDLDAIGTAVEAGTHLLVGVVPGTDSTLGTPKATASRLHGLWRELGFPAEGLHTAVTLTPACGLAGATPVYARAAMGHVREAAKYLLPD